jgi:hypothetical protein
MFFCFVRSAECLGLKGGIGDHGSSNGSCSDGSANQRRYAGHSAGHQSPLSGSPAEVVSLPQQIGQGPAQSPLICLGGENIAVMNVPSPLSRDPREEVWVRAATTWRHAPSVVSGHRAHVLVATLGRLEPLREARVITSVVGGVLDAVQGCSAVMWAGRVVRPASLWRDQSRAAYATYPNYPILLWIDIAPWRTTSGMDAVTIGLSSFVGREIEFEMGRLNPSDALNQVAALAGYLIEHGNVIKDGDTFGGSEAERIRVRHAVSKRLGGAADIASRFFEVNPEGTTIIDSCWSATKARQGTVGVLQWKTSLVVGQQSRWVYRYD